MRKFAWFVGFSAALLATGISVRVVSADAPKIEPLLLRRAALASGVSHVIIRAPDKVSLAGALPAVVRAGGVLGRPLPIINGHTAVVPNAALNALAHNPLISRVSLDRPTAGALDRTAATIGATAVRQELGVDGSGVTVAVIDSGVTRWHDDLAGLDGTQRVDAFVDFVGAQTTPYDGYGHGTHVAGIIAGNGFDSGGARSGIAPASHLVVLKVLDANGAGRISDVIAALDYIVANKDALKIRVVNLSVAAGVYESYYTDPLTLATKRVVDAGIVVVAAAGNAGRDPAGNPMYGGITAPGNAPWVLTVGAASHMGTIDPADDTVAAFSSRGPTAYDFSAKPDIVAPAVGIESLADPDGTLYSDSPTTVLSGTVDPGYMPYQSLTGTSMAAPVVSGTVALMLQANPTLTPNAVKAILQYTARVYPAYDALTEGAGMLNARGAVNLARQFSTGIAPDSSVAADWGARIVWGSHVLTGGVLTADANAWRTDVTWGSAWFTSNGDSITWGSTCDSLTCASASSWQTACGNAACTSIVWGDVSAANIVWGSACGGADCSTMWTIAGAGTAIVGATDGDTVVWGSSSADTVVWGSSDGDTVVWGSACTDAACTPTVWPRR